MEDDINCQYVTWLQDLALTNIIIELWKNAYIPSYTLEFQGTNFIPTASLKILTGHYTYWWPKIIKTVQLKGLQLALPKSLEDILLDRIKGSGKSILMFLRFLQSAKRGLTFNKKLFVECVKWTSNALIDYEKSVSFLLQSSTLNSSEKLALSDYYSKYYATEA